MRGPNPVQIPSIAKLRSRSSRRCWRKSDVGWRQATRDVDRFLVTLRNFAELVPEYPALTAYRAVAYLKTDQAATYAERPRLFVVWVTGSRASVTIRFSEADRRGLIQGNRLNFSDREVTNGV